MKTVTLSLFLFVLCISVYAQDENQCHKLVELTKECINNKDSDPLTQHLSEEFTMANRKGKTASVVLKQIISQLNDTIVSITPLAVNKIGNELELKYIFEYSEMGEKETSFLFDENSLLKELELFKIEIKTMAEKTDIIQNNNEVIEIPFTMVRNLIAVDVLLNGEKRKFLLDTGAPRVILNTNHLPNRDSSHKSLSSSKDVNGSISGMDITQVEHLDFAGIQLKQQDVIAMDLSHLEESLDFEFYGLIGYEMIKNYDILFDYENHQLTLILPDHFEQFRNKELSDKNISSVPFQLVKHIPIIEAKIGKETVRLGIDSGAELNLLDDDLFPTMKQHVRNITSDELSGASKESNKVEKGDVKKLTIGASVFKRSMTVFNDISHLNEGYQLNIDGIIGYPILSKQKTLLSFHRKELLFID